MQIRRLVGASTLALVVAVGLSGCLKMDMQLELQSDDTVDGSVIIAVASEYADMLGASPEEFAEQLQSETLELEGARTMDTEAYDDGEYVGSRTTFEGQSLDSFNENDDADALRIVREGNEFVVSGAFDMSDEAGDMGMFGGEFDIVVAITFPGAVSSHDGELSGTTVTWRPSVGERTELNARGSAVEGGGGAGMPIWLLGVIGLVALAVIAVIIVLVVRSGRKGSTAPAPAGYAAPAGQAPPPPGYVAPPPAPPTAGPVPPPLADPGAPEAGAPQAPAAPPAPEAAPPAPEAAPPAPEAPADTVDTPPPPPGTPDEEK